MQNSARQLDRALLVAADHAARAMMSGVMTHRPSVLH